MAEIKVKILAKKSDNKAFKASDDNWYNLNDSAIPYLEKLNKGDEVVVTFEKKGVSRYVSKLTSAGAVETEAETPKSVSSTGYACEVCGKALKDGKFKKCFMCNKTGAVKKDEAKSGPSESGAGKSTFRPYDNPEKSAQIQRGNALNAAAAVASGQQFADPDVAKQFTLLLAEDFLTWLRAE
jgi:hypothetical protein